MRETNFDVVKSFISLNVIQPRQFFSMSDLMKFYVGNQEKMYRGRLKQKVIQEFPEKLMFIQPNYHYEKQLVVCKDIEKENIDPLVDKRTYINKAAEYIKEDIIRFSNEQPT